MDSNQLKEKSLKEMPEAIKAIDKCVELLYNHQNYVDVANALKILEKAKVNFNFVLKRYQELDERSINNDKK